MKFKLLGTAAGGGIPQWNCACPLCTLSRTHPSIAPPRLQLQAAVSSNGQDWFLLNASPDLRLQIESNPELQPHPRYGKRNTPISGIVLTSADLDQVLGVLLLREFQPLTIYTTALIRRILEANTFFRMLERVPNQLTWVEILPDQPFQLGEAISCTPVPLAASLPHYAKDIDAGGQDYATLGLILHSERRRLAYTPALPEITGELLALYQTCDNIFVDGTFWSDAELTRTQSGTPSARAIGHIPMSGNDGTIALLSGITGPKKIYVHINNTNPVLDPRTTEYHQVIDAGWQIGHDGWQLD